MLPVYNPITILISIKCKYSTILKYCKTRMADLLLIAALCLTLQASHGYILLTANMEDVQALAKQLAESPVLSQLNKIWRRASSQFRKEFHARRQGDSTSAGEGKDDADTEVERRTKSIVKDLVALGKSSGYLQPMKLALDAL